MKVLLTDDSMTIRIIIRDLLKELGYTDVTEGRNGQEAWELLCKDHYDLILLDIHMPQLDGLGVLERIKTDPNSTHGDVPVVFITSDTDYRQIERARDLKAFGYIKKPFKREGLEAAITAAHKVQEARAAQAAEANAVPEAEPVAAEEPAAQVAQDSAPEPVAVATAPEPAAPAPVSETPPAPAPKKKRGLMGWMKSLMGG